MKIFKSALFVFCASAICHSSMASIKSTLSQGNIHGKLRGFNVERQFSTATPNRSTLSLGGQIHFRSKEFNHFAVGGAFFAANDLNSSSNDPQRVMSVVPSEDIEVLGEAYVSYKTKHFSAIGGRHSIKTPFANPSDAFMIPITYNGLSLSSTPTANIGIHLHYINQIKNRPSDQFVNMGHFATDRLTGTGQPSPGMAILGFNYKRDPWTGRLWAYSLKDNLDTFYLDVNYCAQVFGKCGIYAKIQGANQTSNGDKFLGKVSSSIYGAKIGLKVKRFDLSLASVHVASDDSSLMGGGFITPYTYYTGPFFTNSMLFGMENTGPGDSMKVTALYAHSDRLKFKVSHANYNVSNYNNASLGHGRQELDLDATRNYTGDFEGLSFRVRYSILSAENEANEIRALRLQLEQVF